MVVRRKKKSRKLRASRTHGWGFGKQHRGKGHKGGAGFSGVGKRGGQVATRYSALGIKPIGRKGFRLSRREIVIKPRIINLKDLEEKINGWLVQKLIRKENDVYVVNLSKLGYDKLLSDGHVSKKLKISCKIFSKKAKQKIERAGGSISKSV